ncbi:hypothetical protein LB503_003933 [Fusarium chuoi]|nr:hypothetical protein LB503_003933 [Fusarium chuoi]
MKFLDRQRLSRNPFRDNNITLLVSSLLLAAPITVFLLHCVYQTYSRKDAHWSHNHDILEFNTHHEPDVLLYVASYNGCAGSPSWLTLDWYNGVLYCTDEGLKDGKHGSLASFATHENGTLTLLAKTSTVFGPVSAVMYGEWDYGLAVAHYGGSAFTTWDIQDPANLTSLNVQQFSLPEPGPDPSRQEASHPHAAVVDPSKRFILVPDLGADMIHIYGVGFGDLGLGPRHIAFVVKETKTFMYLVNELANTIIGYEVVYGGDFIRLKEIWNSGIHGEGKDVPQGAAAAEIVVSPDREFLIVSSRNESTLQAPDFDTSNGTIASDPLVSFKIDSETGHLTLQQDIPCGGRFPRHFSINKAGTLVAVALQSDSRVVIIERDAETGILGDFIAHAELEGEVTAVVFSE